VFTECVEADCECHEKQCRQHQASANGWRQRLRPPHQTGNGGPGRHHPTEPSLTDAGRLRSGRSL